MKVPILSDLKSQGESPEYLFWVGCAGSFDDRSKKVTKAFVKILNKANISSLLHFTYKPISNNIPPVK